MAEKTIEILSKHKGKISVLVKGENRRITFTPSDRDPNVATALVDHDEAEVLLKPALKDDFWKEAIVVQEQTKAPAPGSEGKGEGGKSEGKAKAADLIEKIKLAQTIEEVDEIVGNDERATVLSAADVRKEELEDEAKKKAASEAKD